MKKIVSLVILLSALSVTSAQSRFPLSSELRAQHELRAKEMEQRRLLHEQVRAQHLEQMRRDLSLSEAQVAQIRALQNRRQKEALKFREEFRQKNHQFRENLREGHENFREDLQEILTPSQWERWKGQRRTQK